MQLNQAESCVVLRTELDSDHRGGEPTTRSVLDRALVACAFLVGLLGLVLAASTGVASAAEDVNDYVPVTGVDRLPNPGIYTDHSGVALHPDGRIFAVDNGEDVIIEYFPNGNGGWNLGRIFEVGRRCFEDDDEDCTERFSEPIDDLEDITFMGGNKWALIDESDNSLMVFTIPDFGTEVQEIYAVDLWPYVDNFGGNGIEGLAYSFDDSVGNTDTFYVASEVNALLVRIDIVNGSVTYKGPEIRLRVPSASAVHDVQGEDVFYIVANGARELYRFNSAGVQLGPPRSISDFFVPEGITFTPDLNRMIIVGEAGGGNQIQEFRAPAGQPGKTAYSRVALSAADAHQGSAGITSNSAVLPIGQSSRDITGLRFASLCVPRAATITSAYLALFPNGSSFDPADIRYSAQRTPQAAAFRPERVDDLSKRIPTVTSLVQQGAPGWSGDLRVYSPDLTELINEVIHQSGWSSCNPVALRLSSTGLRNAASFDLNAELAPTLVVNYVDGPLPDSIGTSIVPSCLGNAGRVDVTLVNNFSVARVANVRFTGLPDRPTTIEPFSTSTVTYTGRNNGRYLVRVESNGATNTSEAVELSCTGGVTVSEFCLSENGLFHVWVYNGTPEFTDMSVTVEGIQPRTVEVAPYGRSRVGVSGRRDGTYQISVNNGFGAEVFRENFVVACDPPLPEQEVTILVGCLAGNGAIRTTLYNQTAATATYTVQVGALGERVRVVESGKVAQVTVTGRSDGAYQLLVKRDGVTARNVTVFVSCDPVGNG